MLFIENLQGELTNEQLEKVVKESLKGFSSVKKVLLIHPDYTRTDFTDRLVPPYLSRTKEQRNEPN